jgi:cytochrome c biogenesis protein CcdA
MDGYLVALGSALWLGILTSISPCPLATNIAAITYIGRGVERPPRVLLSGLAYTLGRVLCYVALAMILVTGVWAIPKLAFFLQNEMNKLLGPILIVVGLVLLEIIPIKLPGMGVTGERGKRFERYGIWGAGMLGILFASSLCPVSAALFFGSLIPLAVEHQSNVAMPVVFGLGTALPVVVFAFLIAFGSGYVGSLFNRLTQIALWARRITAVIFILVGVYYVLVYLAGLDI